MLILNEKLQAKVHAHFYLGKARPLKTTGITGRTSCSLQTLLITRRFSQIHIDGSLFIFDIKTLFMSSASEYNRLSYRMPKNLLSRLINCFLCRRSQADKIADGLLSILSSMKFRADAHTDALLNCPRLSFPTFIRILAGILILSTIQMVTTLTGFPCACCLNITIFPE